MTKSPYQQYPPYQQVYNPYQYQPQPMWQQQYPQQPQQIQQQPVQQGIQGRCVNSESDIAPSEVPMDGTLSWFPLADGSAVYAKKWNADGTISTSKFVMESAPEPVRQLTVDDVNRIVDQRLASLGGEQQPIGNHVRNPDGC